MGQPFNKSKYKIRDSLENGLLNISDKYQSDPMTGLLGYQDFGMRHDNSAPKGLGYFGLLPMATRPPYQQQVATEYSFGVPINGVEKEIPSIVPTLTQQEIDWILNTGDLTEEIQRKAYAHALMKLENGDSPFAD